MAIPNIQTKTVLHTSAIVLDKGLITFDIVTAIGTEIVIDRTNRRINIIST